MTTAAKTKTKGKTPAKQTTKKTNEGKYPVKNSTKNPDAPTPEQAVADRIIKLLDRGELPPWEKGWSSSKMGYPQNAVSKKPYRGINNAHENPVTTPDCIHIRGAAGEPLCGAQASLYDTLPPSSVQPPDQPDSYAWAEDRLPKALACPPCLKIRDGDYTAQQEKPQ